MKYKILIKGLGDATGEDYWDLTNDQVNRFLGPDNIAYATSHFENGKPVYTLVTKKFWDNKEKFTELGQKIMIDAGLSEEQKNTKISELLLELS